MEDKVQDETPSASPEDKKAMLMKLANEVTQEDDRAFFQELDALLKKYNRGVAINQTIVFPRN